MSNTTVPSLRLLRAFLRPSKISCMACQTRSASNFMPRHKYAQVTKLDKLHRQQRAARLQQKEDSKTRAQLLESTLQQISTEVGPQAPPFHIARTKSRNLPIYESTEAGGSKQITTVRKLSGDLTAAQKELRAVLQLPEIKLDSKGRKKEPVAVNNLTQHIVISGWRAPEVKKWAEVLGF